MAEASRGGRHFEMKHGSSNRLSKAQGLSVELHSGGRLPRHKLSYRTSIACACRQIDNPFSQASVPHSG